MISVLLILCNTTFADDIRLKEENRNYIYNYNNLRIILNYNTIRRNRPRYILCFFKGDTLVNHYDGVGFRELFLSSDAQYFLGTSNDGCTKHAFVVFDRQGNIIKSIKHGNSNLEYRLQSASFVQEWYNEKEPEVEFCVENGKLIDIKINSSRLMRFGEQPKGFRYTNARISLLDIDEEDGEGNHEIITHTIGKVRIVVNKKNIDSDSPLFTTCFFEGDSLIKIINDCNIENICSSENGLYHVGIGTDNCCGTYCILFDSHCNIYKVIANKEIRQFRGEKVYRREQIPIWFERPEVKFIMKYNRLYDVRVKTRIELEDRKTGARRWYYYSLFGIDNR